MTLSASAAPSTTSTLARLQVTSGHERRTEAEQLERGEHVRAPFIRGGGNEEDVSLGRAAWVHGAGSA